MRRGGIPGRLLLRTPSFVVCLAPPGSRGCEHPHRNDGSKEKELSGAGGGLTKLEREWGVGQYRDVLGGHRRLSLPVDIDTTGDLSYRVGSFSYLPSMASASLLPVDSLVLRFWEDLPDSLQVIVHQAVSSRNYPSPALSTRVAKQGSAQ